MNKRHIVIYILTIAVIAVGALLFPEISDDTENISDEPSFSETSETTAETEPETETVTETENITEEITEIFSQEAEEYFTDGENYVEYHFRNENLLNQHFEKHGGEFADDFGYQSAQEYEKGASDVVNNTDALFKYEAEDGDGVYYLEQTNEFVILSTDGYIRTYFRPTKGIDYFNRQ